MRITVEKIGTYTGRDAGGWWILAVAVDGTRTAIDGPFASLAGADLALLEVEATMRRHAQAELAAARRAA